MKKLIALFLALIMALSMLVSCDAVLDFIYPDSGDGTHNETPEEQPEEQPEEKPEEKPEAQGYKYTDFKGSEKTLFANEIGAIIPFLPTDEYILQQGYSEEYQADYILLRTFGNTEGDFTGYRASLVGYTLTETFKDSDGYTRYCYESDEIYMEARFFEQNGSSVAEIFVFYYAEDNGGSEEDDGGYIYTSFTEDEKKLFLSIVGAVIPFAPNNEYYVEEDYDYYYESDYVVFYTFGNTEEDFREYLKLYSSYTLVETFKDDYGDTWYCYEKGDVYVELSFYYYEGDYVIDVYAYGTPAEDNGSGGSGSGNNGGNGGNEGGSTNLPEGTNGIYEVDFTKAAKVKDVTDQGYYLDGCPTTGSPAVLVIPVEFSDVTASSKGLSIDSIEEALVGDADYYSLYEYYYISSGGKLTLDITVLDGWFRPRYSSSYYENATIDYYGEDIYAGDMLIIDEALQYLEGIMDLSDFDSDNNSIIDSIILVTTLDVGDDDFHWAYRYWNVYTDEEGYYFEYDEVSANDYIWMCADFIHESYDAYGETIYTDRSVINSYTLIHEFGHVLGLDDAYDTSGATDGPLEGCDMMDAMTGDHNPFSKFNLGWITSTRLITGSATLTLGAFGESGDTVIIANSFDPTLGAYQEYYIICYYTNTGLNGGEDYGFFARDGILVYHVNATLYSEEYDGEIYYDILNNNTSPTDEYGTEDNLIEFVKSAEGNFTYVVGDSLPVVTDDLGNLLNYTLVIEEISESGATITITRN